VELAVGSAGSTYGGDVTGDVRPTERKRRGAWYTPVDLVDTIVAAVVTADVVERAGNRPVAVLDPACGDGRFLAAADRRVRALGGRTRLVGVDVDPAAAATAAVSVPAAEIVTADALRHDWNGWRFDLVIGNPPFLSQLATATTRGGASGLGGGPYADAAAEFLALGASLVEPAGGRLAFVVPQSLLSARDAEPIRRRIDDAATMVWSWWSRRRVFDADVDVCAVAFEFGRDGVARRPGRAGWGRVVTDALGIPAEPVLQAEGVLGDHVRLNANFRDEYYAMVPAVGDHPGGPPLVTSGLIDPGSSRWGERPIRFAGRSFRQPRLDLERLDARMVDWAARRLVPKVLVANQTRIVEAVCDPTGDWLPGVPVVAAYPIAVHWDRSDDPERRIDASSPAVATVAWEAAAVLTSPVASVWLWHRQAGTGLSADAIRVSPTVLADLPWPAGDLAPAVEALRGGDVRSCAVAVDRAYGVVDDAATVLEQWWRGELERIERRTIRAQP
jgi:hypothetical protein